MTEDRPIAYLIEPKPVAQMSCQQLLCQPNFTDLTCLYCHVVAANQIFYCYSEHSWLILLSNWSYLRICNNPVGERSIIKDKILEKLSRLFWVSSIVAFSQLLDDKLIIFSCFCPKIRRRIKIVLCYKSATTAFSLDLETPHLALPARDLENKK